MPEGEFPKMEMQEEPLLYPEAINALRKFERQHGIDSNTLFMGLAHGKPSVKIDPDDLFEWRSYFEFAKQVEEKLANILEKSPEVLDDVFYSVTTGLEPTQKAIEPREHRTLALAA